MVEYEDYEQIPEKLLTQIHRAVFSDEEFNKKNNLDYSIRMLPHHNNDGGFFAALLKKVKPLPWEKIGKERTKSAEELKKSKYWHFFSSRVKGSLIRETMDDPIMPKIKSKSPTKIPTKNGKNRKVINHFVDKTKFFQFFDANHGQINKLLEFYGIDADPELFFRSSKRHILLANQAIKDIVNASEMKHNVFFGGLKVFKLSGKGDSRIRHKMTMNGRNLLLDFVNENRKLEITFDEMKKLIESYSPLDQLESIEIKDVLNDNSIKAIENINNKNGLGPVCFVYKDLKILAHVGQYKITQMINKNEQVHAKLML